MAKIPEASSNISDFMSNNRIGISINQNGEELFLGTAESEHTEMYLKLFGTSMKKVKMPRLAQ